MAPWLRLIGWLACIVYASVPAFWLMVHPFAARWRQSRRSPYVLLLPLWIVTWVVLGAITAPWRDILLYSSPLALIPAIAILAIGIWLYVHASKEFSPQQLGGVPEIQTRSGQRLVTSGIRERIRHPIYLGHLCELAAWSIGTGLAVCFALTALAIVTGAVMIRKEDEELERRFGDEYRVYRQRVPA